MVPDNPKLLVLDLGAHDGVDTEIYLARGFRVVALEANPMLASALADRLTNYTELTVEARALDHSPGQVELHVPVDEGQSLWATTSPRQLKMLKAVDVPVRPVQVATTSLAELFDRYGVAHYVKCDIEGTDTTFLEMLVHDQRRPDTISFELTQSSMGELLRQLRLLKLAGYQRYYLRDQQRLPTSAYVDGREYPIASMWSGPFGHEIDDGTHLTFARLRRRALLVAVRSRLFGEFGLAGRLGLYGAFRRLSRLPIVGCLFYTSWYDVHCFSPLRTQAKVPPSR